MTKAVTRDEIMALVAGYRVACINCERLSDEALGSKYDDWSARRKETLEALEAAITGIIRERDEAVAAIRNNWEKHGLRNGVPAYYCLFCNKWAFKDGAFKDKPIEHSSECITRRIEQ